MNPKKVEETNKFSSIKDHKRIGKELISPINVLGVDIKPIIWDKDLLPEFLWIDALAQKFGVTDLHNQFYRFIDKIESYISEKDTYLIGFISDFNKIKEDVRELILQNEESIIKNYS